MTETQPLLSGPSAPLHDGLGEAYLSVNGDDTCQDDGRGPPCSPVIDRVHEYSQRWLGRKTIGLFGSIVLITNNISGPAQLALPAVYQSSGWLVPTALMLCMSVLSAAVAALLCESIAMVPGNSYAFEKRIEFASVFRHFGGRWAGAAAQMLFLACLMSQALASIVQTAQVLDGLFASAAGGTYALVLAREAAPAQAPAPAPAPASASAPVSHGPPSPSLPALVRWSPDDCVAVGDFRGQLDAAPDPQQPCTPFAAAAGGGSVLCISAGYVTAGVLLAPLGLWNLDDNITVQMVSFVMLVLLSAEFIAHFATKGFDFSNVPAVGPNPLGSIGAVIFNYAFVVFLPSWLNEKRRAVPPGVAIWSSACIATVLFVLLGVLGAASYAHADANILVTLLSRGAGPVTQGCAFAFGFGIIGLGIPVMTIMMRYGLQVQGYCTPLGARIVGVGAPWLLGWLLYGGASATTLMNWAGLTVNGAVNFIAPALLARRVFADSRPRAAKPPADSLSGAPAPPSALPTVLCGLRLRHRERRLSELLLLVLVPVTVFGTVTQMILLVKG